MGKEHRMNPVALVGLIVVAVLITWAPFVRAQTGAKLVIEPDKGTYGLQVFLKGSGFAPNSQVQIQAFGQTIAPQAMNTGEFLVIAFAPTDQSKFKPGPLKITAKDNSGNSAEGTFTLEELVTTVQPGQAGGSTGGAPATTPGPAPAATGPGSSSGLLIGVVVAAVIGLAVLVFAVVFFSTRRKVKVQGPPEAVRPGPSVRPARSVAAAPGGGAPEPVAAQTHNPGSATATENETTLVMPSIPKLSTRPTLQVIGGDDAGTVYSLDQKTTILGRGDDCDIVVNHPMVSRHHAKIVRVGPSYYIHDLQSTNSTLVNGQRIDQHVLQPEDEIQIGVTLFLFQQPQGE